MEEFLATYNLAYWKFPSRRMSRTLLASFGVVIGQNSLLSSGGGGGVSDP